MCNAHKFQTEYVLNMSAVTGDSVVSVTAHSPRGQGLRVQCLDPVHLWFATETTQLVLNSMLTVMTLH